MSLSIASSSQQINSSPFLDRLNENMKIEGKNKQFRQAVDKFVTDCIKDSQKVLMSEESFLKRIELIQYDGSLSVAEKTKVFFQALFDKVALKILKKSSEAPDISNKAVREKKFISNLKEFLISKESEIYEEIWREGKKAVNDFKKQYVQKSSDLSPEQKKALQNDVIYSLAHIKPEIAEALHALGKTLAEVESIMLDSSIEGQGDQLNFPFPPPASLGAEALVAFLANQTTGEVKVNSQQGVGASLPADLNSQITNLNQSALEKVEETRQGASLEQKPSFQELIKSFKISSLKKVDVEGINDKSAALIIRRNNEAKKIFNDEIINKHADFNKEKLDRSVEKSVHDQLADESWDE